MALERKPQNLRGYGLAQDPKVELDTTFIDDQNRRAYQQRGIEAQQEAQQKNFAQRDKETRVDLLKGIPTIESNWSPEIKNKINTEIDAFIKGAGDLSTEEIVVGLNGLKSKAGAYKSIGTALKDRATKVAAGDIYSGLDGDKLLGLKLEEDFKNLTFEEAMAKAMNITQSQFAPMPDMTQWETLKNNVYDFAKSSSTGEMEYAGNLGDKSYGRFAFNVDPNAKIAAVSNFMTGNRGFYNLYAEKNDLEYDEIESTLSSQIDDVVFDKWAENTPKADKEFKPTYSRGGGSSLEYNYGVSEGTRKEEGRVPQGLGFPNVDINMNYVDIIPKDGKTLPLSKIKGKNGEVVTGVIVSVTEGSDGDLKLVVNKKLSSYEQTLDLYNQAKELLKANTKELNNFNELNDEEKLAKVEKLVLSGKIKPKTETTELLDYESNKNLVAPNRKEIYKMLGDVRAYENPEQIKEDGFTYFAKQDGSDPIGIDELHKTFLNEKRKGDTFGEYIKGFDYIPQEGDMPNVGGAKVVEDFSEFEVKG